MKKYSKIIMVVIIIFIIGMITYFIDSNRVSENKEPKFTIKILSQNGGKVTYFGLGYKVIRYVGVSPKEKFESNIGLKMGTWFMQYELSEQKSIIKIESIDDFYNLEITKNKDIRILNKEYSFKDAELDSCFIGTNINIYHKFMEDYQNKKTSFIRVANTTIEGDLILYDILYEETTNQIYLILDDTRDKFSTNKKIILKQFESTKEYQDKEYRYWVLYNEEITEEKIQNGDVFVVSILK